MRSCADCMCIKCRCDSCFALVEIDGKWFCDEQEMPCEEVDYCYEWYGSNADCNGEW